MTDFSTNIADGKTLKRMVKKANEIHVQARFGVSEDWVRITKREAAFLIRNIASNDTPDQYEMCGSSFGCFRD